MSAHHTFERLAQRISSPSTLGRRFIEIRGRAETYTDGGEEVGKRINANKPFDSASIRICPRRILTMGIDGDPFELSARDVA
jgi:pyridoxamine 5'-phosphate oxidase family protein